MSTAITLSTAITFASLAFFMALSPGPNLLYLASRSISQGRGAGFASLAGVCSGMLVYMCATAAGLSAVFAAVPYTYDVLRFSGAAYLLWLAYKAFRTPLRSLKTSALSHEPFAQLFRRGFLTCLLNPKIVFVYGALLPQFIQPGRGTVVAQTFQLGLLQIIAAAVAHSCVIIGASTVSSLFRRVPGFARAQQYLLGFTFITLAARLGFERRNAA